MSTRDAILTAANEAYVESGYAGLSLRAIAKEVGITPMAIYRHFKDKDDLMHHVVLEGLALWRKRLSAIGPQEDPWDRLLKVGQAYVRFADKHRSYFEVVFLSTDQVSHLRHQTEAGAGAFSDAFRLYASWVRDCLPEAEQEEVLDAAIDIWAYSHGLVALYLAGRLQFLNVSFASYHTHKLAAFLETKKHS